MKSTGNIPALRHLWKQCFDADNAFLDLFFNKGFSRCNTFCIEDAGDTVSALSVFPVEYRGHKGGYVYGVCTAPEHRGHGYALKLLSDVERHCSDKMQMDFFILRPASGPLFGYYRKAGYTLDIYRNQAAYSLPSIPVPVAAKPLTGEELYELRRSCYYDMGLFEWSPDACGYILDYIRYCHGYAVRAEDNREYFLGYTDAEHPDTVICEEAGTTDLQSPSPILLSMVKNLYPSADRILLGVPSGHASQSFMLCKTEATFINPHSIFDFTME